MKINYTYIGITSSRKNPLASLNSIIGFHIEDMGGIGNLVDGFQEKTVRM
jgi:hypothetical protein